MPISATRQSSGQTVQVLHKLSMNALANTVVAHDDVLFCSGDLATAAYFVQSGHMRLGLHYPPLRSTNCGGGRGRFAMKSTDRVLDNIYIYIYVFDIYIYIYIYIFVSLPLARIHKKPFKVLQ